MYCSHTSILHFYRTSEAHQAYLTTVYNLLCSLAETTLFHFPLSVFTFNFTTPVSDIVSFRESWFQRVPFLWDTGDFSNIRNVLRMYDWLIF